MTARITFALLLGLAGCEGVHSAYLTPGERAAHEVRMPKGGQGVPAAEASAVRALTVTQKVLDANPALGARPTLITLGSPKKSLFHTGNPQATTQMYISQGLIDACTDDARLAAVVCIELGKIAAERAAQAAIVTDDRPPIVERVGNDDRGAYAAGDGTRLMEAAKREAALKKKAPKADPAALARRYLTAAGYPADAMKQVAGLIGELEREDTLADHFTADKPVILQKPVPKVEPKKPGG